MARLQGWFAHPRLRLPPYIERGVKCGIGVELHVAGKMLFIMGRRQRRRLSVCWGVQNAMLLVLSISAPRYESGAHPVKVINRKLLHPESICGLLARRIIGRGQ